MRKIGFWALLAATVISGAVMAGCGGHIREPYALSDPRFNGVFQYDRKGGGGFDRWEFDGTSKCYRVDNVNVDPAKYDWYEFEVDKENHRYRARYWDDDAKWENEWVGWYQYVFSEDGNNYWMSPDPEAFANQPAEIPETAYGILDYAFARHKKQ